MSTVTDILALAEERMKKAVAALLSELQTFRAGRANPKILDRVEVDYYGTPTPLKSLGNISVPEGRQLLISPYDKSTLKEIEKAIHNSGLGLTPNNDGSVIRINIPVPTEERRKEMCKQVRALGEEQRIIVRGARRDAVDDVKKLKSEIPEDEIKRQEESLQKLTDKYIKEIDRHIKDKEDEIMEI